MIAGEAEACDEDKPAEPGFIADDLDGVEKERDGDDECSTVSVSGWCTSGVSCMCDCEVFIFVITGACKLGIYVESEGTMLDGEFGTRRLLSLK